MIFLISQATQLHFYCKSNEIDKCIKLREQFVEDLKVVGGAGSVRSSPVGPHPLPMFKSWFDNEHLDKFLRWAMKNRKGLSVVIHLLSGDDQADHRDHSLWLGEQLALKLALFTE